MNESTFSKVESKIIRPTSAAIAAAARVGSAEARKVDHHGAGTKPWFSRGY
jgi:hypothetical protein